MKRRYNLQFPGFITDRYAACSWFFISAMIARISLYVHGLPGATLSIIAAMDTRSIKVSRETSLQG